MVGGGRGEGGDEDAEVGRTMDDDCGRINYGCSVPVVLVRNGVSIRY